MSDGMSDGTTDGTTDGMNDAALEALRAQGAHLHDPVRFRYLEALAARMRSQHESVRRALAPGFEQAVAALRARMPQAQDAPSKTKPHAATATTSSPLARLNHDIGVWTKGGVGEASASGRDGGIGSDLADDIGSPSDMKSVRRFAEVWSKISTEQQLSQALTRGPELAGPLNSHNLMLRALSLMHGLSPDYLRRFLAQADALLWLDHMNQQTTLKDGKTARRGRVKK